jgi:hypothetical protein
MTRKKLSKSEIQRIAMHHRVAPPIPRLKKPKSLKGQRMLFNERSTVSENAGEHAR